MGLAGWFLYAKWSLNEATMEKLNQDYEEMGRLNSQRPHPGAGQVDNIKAAKEQQKQWRDYLLTARKNFQRIPPIPDLPKPSDQDVSGALSRTIAEMQLEATNASVSLPAGYNFSFEAQKARISFAAGSLEPLASQLGEIKAICDALFAAKINSLDYVRRERVSADDFGTTASVADYLEEKSVTNELAVLTPYQLSFRCFSSELAAVLAGFANSPYALLVKTMNIEPALAMAEPPPQGAGAITPYNYTPPPMPPPESPEAALARRFGLPGGVGQRPVAAGAATRYAQGGQPGAKGGLPTVLDERPLKITMDLNVVKLLPVPAK